MKSVTIENVKARIAELEMIASHGELSLRGEFELACLRQLVVSMDGKPFMYGIADPDGAAHMDEFCVSTSIAGIEDAVNALNEECEEGGPLYRVVALYRHYQPLPERNQVRADHAEWSQETFGNVGPIGPLKHLAKEAMEAAAAPELDAIVERLNLSGYEYEGGEVTPQNAAAIVDTLLQQLDDAVQGRNAQPAPEVYNIGDATMRHIFTPTGMTDVSDMQAVFDRVETVLVELERKPQVLPPQYGHLHTAPYQAQEPATDNTAQQFEELANSTKCKRCDDEGWVADEMGITQCGCGTTTSAGKVKS